MAKSRKDQGVTGELVPFQPASEVQVLPPDTGVVGQFLEDTQNMFKARSMRMRGLFSRINESGERMELMLRAASERAEAAEARLEDHLRREGLLPELRPDGEKDEK